MISEPGTGPKQSIPQKSGASASAGMLYLVPTPIGNLEDMTLRAIRILKEADLIAAEDTRNSIRLLNHFDIHTPLTSYHEYNKIEKAYELIEKMQAGKIVALITDAGTPGISDPGEDLVRLCYEAGVEVTSLPGACACVTALTLSGLPTRRFCFEAFLPVDKKERRAVLEELKTETRTSILYEAPHHLAATLQELYDALGERKVTLCRELTKIHEQAQRMTLQEAATYYAEHEPRGEFVIVIEGLAREILVQKEQQSWETLTVAEHVDLYIAQGMEKRDAMKAAAKDRGISKRDVYKALV